jgi:ATP-binding cassette, subfamily B, bacterial
MNGILKIVRYTWALKRFYFISIILVIVTSLLNQATPFILEHIVNTIVSHNRGTHVDFNLIIILLLLILVVNLSITLLSNIEGYYGDMLGVKIDTLLSQRYFTHILKLPLKYYDDEIAGKITSRLERSIVTISQLIKAFANNFIGIFLTSAITIIILAYYAWPVAILLIILFPFYVWLTSLSSKDWQSHQEPINHETDINNGRFIESISQIRVVKSFVTEILETTLFSSRRKKIENITKLQSRQWHKYNSIRQGALNLIFFLIYSYIAVETYNGHYNLGQFTLLITLVAQAQIPLYSISFLVDTLQRASAGSKDFFEVMNQNPDIIDAADATDLAITKGEVEFRNVSFAYAGDQNVINDVSFKIKAGQKLALVGESGEGKTTISNLLLRFYDINSGQILVDDNDIAGVKQKSLRQNIGVVFQEPALFSGTIKDNISYGTPDATDEQIKQAVIAANAMKFIDKFPKKLDTQIGERGVKLSGGQRQRIAIARAILKDPPILILDEATSALDSRSEHEVQLALGELMKNRTTLIIAHRLSTIANVDTIVSLQNGRVLETGSPAQLAQAGGIYEELLALQNPTSTNKAKLRKYDISR